MNPKGEAGAENIKKNQNLPQLSILKEKTKLLCKLSQEKHVLRMAIARSRNITRKIMSATSSPNKVQNSNIKTKKVVASDDVKFLEDVNHKKQQKFNRKIKSAPKETTVKKTQLPCHTKACKNKSQVFPFLKHPEELNPRQRKCQIQKKATVFSNSTPKDTLTTKNDWQNDLPITINETSTTTDTIKNCTKLSISKIPKKKVSQASLKDLSMEKTLECDNPAYTEIKTVEKVTIKTPTKTVKKTQDNPRKSPFTKIPTISKTTPIKKTEATEDISKLKKSNEMTEKQEICFNPTYLTSYELGLAKNEENGIENSDIQDNSNTLYQSCDNIVNEDNDGANKCLYSIEDTFTKSSLPISQEKVRLHHTNDTPSKMANKVLKYSLWRKNSNSPLLRETKQDSFGTISAEKLRSKVEDEIDEKWINCSTNSMSSSSQYFTPPSFMMDEDSKAGIIVGDLSIDELDAFKVKTENESKSKMMSAQLQDGAKFKAVKSADSVDFNGICDKTNEIHNYNSKTNKSPKQPPGDADSLVWINFAKAFAENSKKSRIQKKLREMDFDRPFLNLDGDATLSPEKLNV